MDSLPGTLTPLCFDRADFTQPDFNVEIFLSSLRRRVSFEQIQDDLRLYLKILQNAMIELINQDYADFVNLSSNLVNLRATINKLEGDLLEISKEFESATSELEKAIGELSVYLEGKNERRSNQRKLEEQIRIISLLRKMMTLIATAQKSEKVPPILIERISELLFSLRIAVDACTTSEQHSFFVSAFQNGVDAFQKMLDEQLISSVNSSEVSMFSVVLTGYQSCRRRDSALALFISEFLEPSIKECLRTKQRTRAAEKLQTIFATLLSLREKFQQQLTERRTQRIDFLGLEEKTSTEATVAFLNDSLLTVLLTVLDSDFSSVTIPTDADIFHQCYTALLDITRQWPDPAHPLLKMAIRKFSLPVYFRMRCHEISHEFDKAFSSTVVLPAVSANSRFHLQTTVLLNEALEKTWSNTVYLTPLTAKLWDYSCKLLGHYGQWIEKVLASRKNLVKHSALESENDLYATNGEYADCSSARNREWQELVRLLADVSQTESAVCELAFEQIWPKFRVVDADTTKFGECLTAGMNEVKKTVSGANSVIVSILSNEMSELLKEVAEVPRQYRWTRKEAPSQPSVYLKSAFALLAEFDDFAQKCFLSADQIENIIGETLRSIIGNYLEKVQNVLVSVYKISSSLSKLKRSGKFSSAGGEGTTSMTDDQKIRLQLGLDLAEFRTASLKRSKLSAGLGIDWSFLEELENTAKSAGEIANPGEVN